MEQETLITIHFTPAEKEIILHALSAYESSIEHYLKVSVKFKTTEENVIDVGKQKDVQDLHYKIMHS